MKKRGQITLFIILGIVILLFVGLFFYMRGDESEIAVIKQPELMPIRNYVTACLEKSSEEVVFEYGLIGANKNPIKNIPFEDKMIPAYNTRLKIPRISYLEKDLGEDILTNFLECFEIDVIEKFGFDVDTGTPKMNISAYDDSVTARLTFPLRILKQDYKAEISDFSVILPLGLKNLYENAIYLVAKAEESGSYEIRPEDCNLLNYNGLTATYVNDYSGDYKIIKFIDYSAYPKYLESLVFIFAVEGLDLYGSCTG